MRLIFACFLSTLTFALPLSAEELLSSTADWRYFDQGDVNDVNWHTSTFDDSTWAQGAAPLGYGETGVFEVGFGPDPDNKFITTYFRTTFNEQNVSSFTSATFSLIRDDGARVFLNGTEVVRSNLPAGDIDFNTTASQVTGGNNESNVFTFSLDPSLILEGENTLAVEVHQFSPTSSDLRMSLALDASEVSITRGPYLQRVNESEAIVRFRTDAPTKGKVSFGTTLNNIDQSIIEDVDKTDHRIVLTGLSPSTEYFYTLGTDTIDLSEPDPSMRFRTSPTTGSKSAFRMWVVGDSGTGDANARAVRDAFHAFNGDDEVHLFMMLGDNAYNSGTDAEYQNGMFNVFGDTLKQSPVWPTLGNHDGYTANSNTLTGPYYEIFSLPRNAQVGGTASGTEAYYSFDYANVHFVCLNSYDIDRSVGGAMHQWLESDLLANNQEWTIAFFHHPPYTKGSHNSDTETPLIQMRENFLPLLEDHGVDLVMGGHSHVYERSMLIDGHYGPSNTFQTSMQIDPDDGDEDNTGAYQKVNAPHNGTVYAVVGSSAKLRAGTMDHPIMVRSIVQYASLVLDIEDDRLSASVINKDGGQIDNFTIIKGDPATLSISDLVIVGNPNTNEGSTFSYSGQALGGLRPFSYLWNFGDGTTSTAVNPTHFYNDSGNYDVSLTITDANMQSVSRSENVVVQNVAPAVGGPFQILGNEGQTLTLTAIASDVVADPLSYEWSFSDGSVKNGRSVQHTFSDETTTPITLQVSDDDGATTTQMVAVTINNVAPTLNIQVPANAATDVPVAMSAEINDPGDDNVVVNWDFGDGVGATGLNTAHTYAAPGNYHVIIRADDQDGGVAIRQAFVEVEDDADPAAQINIPQSGNEEEALSFSIIGAQNPTWQFGDGSQAAGPSVSHAYADNGEYELVLQYTLNQEARTETRSVSIQNLPPSIISPSAVIGNEGELLSLAALANDVAADPLTYQWTLPNGQVLDGQFPQVTFDDQQNGIILLRVSDDDGATTPRELNLQIANLAPSLFIQVPVVGVVSDFIALSAQVSDPGNDNVEVTWDFGDGQTGVGPSLNHAYAQPGTYTINVSANDLEGGITQRSAVIEISEEEIEAAVLGVPQSAREGESVFVSITNAQNVVWDFDDGTPGANGPSQNHIFADDGVYLIRVRYTQNAVEREDQRTLVVTNVAPLILGPTQIEGDEGETIRLSAVASDVAADPLSYSWLFSDGTLRNGRSIDHVFADQTSAPIQLRVSDDEGLVSTSSVVVNIENVAPSALIVGPQNASANSQVRFAANAQDPGADTLSYQWDFGDGNSSTQNPVDHTYESAGEYTVLLSVSDEDGASTNAELTIIVTDDGGENIQVLAPSVLNEGQSGSFFTNATGGVEWDFGDGERSQDASTTHTYRDDGVYTLTLSYTQNGEPVVVTQTLAVQNLAPRFDDLTDRIEANEGERVLLSADVSDPGDDELRIEWRLSDGRVFEGATVEVLFADNTRSPIEVRATDGDGGIANALVAVNIENLPPTISFDAPDGVFVFESFVLNANVSDPGDDELNVRWDFGDGQSASGLAVQHRYLSAGTYVLSATVSDDDGAFNNVQRSITVTVSDTPFADISVPAIGREGFALDFEIFGASAPSWRFGDGGEATGARVSHTYADDGDYTVNVRYTLNGQMRSDLRLVSVRNLNPVIQEVAPISGIEGQRLVFRASATDVAEDPLRYAWTFPDGSTIFGDNAERVIRDDFDGNIRLRVSDDDGGDAFVLVPMTIVNQAPASTIVAPANGVSGSPTPFSVDILDPSDDTFEVSWDFGDGSQGQGQSVEHTYDANGTYRVVVDVRDDDGGRTQSNIDFEVDDALVSSGDVIIPDEGLEGESLSFQANNIANPRWDFGDESDTLTGANVEHRFSDNGLYRVRLRGSQGGAPYVYETDVRINNVAPEVSGVPSSASVGQLFTFLPTYSDVPDDLSKLSFSLETDAQSARVTDVGVVEFAPIRLDEEAGLRSFTLIVSDDDGGTTRFTFDVAVGPAESNCSQAPTKSLLGFSLLVLFFGKRRRAKKQASK